MPDINGPDIHDYICDMCRVGSLLILLGILIYIILRDIPGIDELVIATYVLGFATLLLGIVALFGPKLIDYIYRPKLKISFERNPPFCHKTTDKWQVSEPAHWWQVNKCSYSEPVYYFRLRVKNHGKSTAKKCEVVLENLWLYDKKGLNEIQNFSHVNLKWVIGAGKKRQYIDINPERGYFCDLGHISSKNYQKTIEKGFIDADGYPVCGEGDLRFMLDLLQVFYAQSNYLCPKITYILKIGLYSENANYQKELFEITWSGKWEDEQDRMFRDDRIEIKKITRLTALGDGPDNSP